jgi:hypothetical protein
MKRDAEQWRQEHLGTGLVPKKMQHFAGFVQKFDIRPGYHEVVMYTMEGLYLYGACLLDNWTAAAYLDTTGNMVRRKFRTLLTTNIAPYIRQSTCMCIIFMPFQTSILHI